MNFIEYYFILHFRNCTYSIYVQTVFKDHSSVAHLYYDSKSNYYTTEKIVDLTE